LPRDFGKNQFRNSSIQVSPRDRWWRVILLSFSTMTKCVAVKRGKQLNHYGEKYFEKPPLFKPDACGNVCALAKILLTHRS
jgi:hypothetical protein